MEGPDQIQPVRIRERDVEQDEIRLQFAGKLEPGLPVGCGACHLYLRIGGKELSNGVSDDRVIIDKEQANRVNKAPPP